MLLLGCVFHECMFVVYDFFYAFQCLYVIMQSLSWSWLLMSASIATRMLQILGLPTLLHKPKVCKNLEVIVLYTQ